MKIRKLKIEDNLKTAQMIRAVFEEYNAPKEGTVYSDPTTDNLFELFKKDKSYFLIAEENNEIVGCCGIYPTDNLPQHCTELVKYYICNSARGKGLGRILMNKCEEKAKSLGYTQLYLESIPAYNKAVSIYKKLGYQQLESPLGNSGHFGCNIWMLKEL